MLKRLWLLVTSLGRQFGVLGLSFATAQAFTQEQTLLAERRKA
jgi:hypothetical protein